MESEGIAPEIGVITRPRRGSFRPLLAFWLIVIGMVGGGGLTLQLTYTPEPARPYESPEDVAREKALAAEKSRHPALPQSPVQPVAPGAINPPDPALLEPVPNQADHFLPKIAADGRTPAQVYAAKLQTAIPPHMGHLALVVDGIGAPGLDGDASMAAITRLPPAVDLVFSAYAPSPALSNLVESARAAGHEFLVSVPMKPESLSASEGDRALLPGATAQNADNLTYALSHIQGYIGATGASDGQAGGGFAQSYPEFSAVIDAIQKRGLIYLDAREQGTNLAPRAVPVMHVDHVIDKPRTEGDPVNADTIGGNLRALESDAAFDTDPGTVAVGLISLASMAGPAKVETLQEIADWAHGLRDRGIVLLPLSYAAPKAAPATK